MWFQKNDPSLVEGATRPKTATCPGEIKVRSSAGSTLYLKGALDENTMKDVTVAFTMKVDEREAARKCQVGDTVTLTGVFPATLPLTAPTVPLREGAIKK